jgi:hypothetical protein
MTEITLTLEDAQRVAIKALSYDDQDGETIFNSKDTVFQAQVLMGAVAMTWALQQCGYEVVKKCP